MNIRLSGFPHEVDRMMHILEKAPGISISRESKDYSNRNSQYVRRYIDIEFTADSKHPQLSSKNPTKEGSQ